MDWVHPIRRAARRPTAIERLKREAAWFALPAVLLVLGAGLLGLAEGALLPFGLPAIAAGALALLRALVLAPRS
ncbi:hypothetical protein [Ancylobacter terrae]|uniref:hypothetical protein n=1 Tax=Ancylobacter sp. sgz301288 TaxID=3342077 RepID=UPI00385EDA5D